MARISSTSALETGMEAFGTSHAAVRITLAAGVLLNATQHLIQDHNTTFGDHDAIDLLDACRRSIRREAA